MQHETSLRDQLAELRRQHGTIADHIKAALIAGTDTAPIRGEAASLSREIAAIERAIADEAVQREAEAQEAILATAPS